ncbi:hypothetical protein CC85DRAFT_302672 [Cutaneotrichosporon oleaginosum]|uniref:Uncharacterized protein n=1 Tax=Cutaneotrichosporon oleaginosum TaxID=879819 RepID=A0A0J1B3C1_9TREE|nr:uncharacterized protein CC85DRAFT_302672 [Cutaneotrichosporon oleaginosum]KLT42119.1 hypothetical protein CC85DRAFT_302672 [Cutaneotrichosporon oleaginosum]TXT04642.1 hypothetical protein COLE_07461 [Cutaneotrichosporon oleaginosum]
MPSTALPPRDLRTLIAEISLGAGTPGSPTRAASIPIAADTPDDSDASGTDSDYTPFAHVQLDATLLDAFAAAVRAVAAGEGEVSRATRGADVRPFGRVRRCHTHKIYREDTDSEDETPEAVPAPTRAPATNASVAPPPNVPESATQGSPIAPVTLAPTLAPVAVAPDPVPPTPVASSAVANAAATAPSAPATPVAISPAPAPRAAASAPVPSLAPVAAPAAVTPSTSPSRPTVPVPAASTPAPAPTSHLSPPRVRPRRPVPPEVDLSTLCNLLAATATILTALHMVDTTPPHPSVYRHALARLPAWSMLAVAAYSLCLQAWRVARAPGMRARMPGVLFVLVAAGLWYERPDAQPRLPPFDTRARYGPEEYSPWARVVDLAHGYVTS